MNTNLSYDLRGRLLSSTTDGQQTSWNYNLNGTLNSTTVPGLGTTQYTYSPTNQVATQTDQLGNSLNYSYDMAGNRTDKIIKNSSGISTFTEQSSFNPSNRLETHALGNRPATQYGYDLVGNLTSTLDPNLNPSSSEYDALNRLIKSIDPLLGETLMGYDPRDNLVSVSDPLGNTTTYDYDGLGNQIELDSPDTGISTYEYDSAGNRTAAIDARGIRVDYSFDVLNRLTSIIYPDSSLNVGFGYDAGTNGKGRLTSMTDTAGTVSYNYDARGNLVSEARSGIPTKTTNYAYNVANQLTQITYPSGMLINYGFDSLGRVISVDKTIGQVTENLISNVQYAPFGPAQSFTYGNGLSMNASFDLDYQLNSLQSGTAINGLYNYDNSGNILSLNDQAIPANSQVFTYDNLYRLDTATGSYGLEDFDYDANSNRTRFLSDLIDDPYTYTPQSNRLSSQNGWAFNRDAVGNRLAKLDSFGYGTLYSYGDHNRLSQVTNRDATGDTLVATYFYDGRGQRVRKDILSSITYSYGLSGELLGEYPLVLPSDDKEYVYLNGQLIAVIHNTNEWVIPNHETITLDNGDAGTSSTGKWRSKGHAQQFGGNHLLANKGSPTYRWTPTLTASQSPYEIRAWWADKKNYSSQVEYTVVHSGGTDIVTQSHKAGGGQWNVLGAFNQIQYVEVSAANGKTVADALQFEESVIPVLVPVVNTLFVHSDHLGTPRAVSDNNQTTVWRWDSTPFGDNLANEDPDGDGTLFNLNTRFPGQYYDSEAGLNYNYFRTYDPSTGRYIESDPIGLRGGLNTFGYVGGNPLRWTDHLGLDEPGCDGVPDFLESNCLLNMCSKHDLCYFENRCTASSWRSPLTKCFLKCNIPAVVGGAISASFAVSGVIAGLPYRCRLEPDKTPREEKTCDE